MVDRAQQDGPGSRVPKYSFDHLRVGDTITVTESIKSRLNEYEAATAEPNVQNIIAKQAQAAAVLGAIWHGTHPEFKRRKP